MCFPRLYYTAKLIRRLEGGKTPFHPRSDGECEDKKMLRVWARNWDFIRTHDFPCGSTRVGITSRCRKHRGMNLYFFKFIARLLADAIFTNEVFSTWNTVVIVPQSYRAAEPVFKKLHYFIQMADIAVLFSKDVISAFFWEAFISTCSSWF